MIQLTKSIEHVIKQEQDILIHKTIPKTYKPITLETDYAELEKNILLTSDKSYH